jgi:hypothetical protein
MFKNKFSKDHPQRAVENEHENGIPGGELCLDQSAVTAVPVADKERDAVYARCGEVFSAP